MKNKVQIPEPRLEIHDDVFHFQYSDGLDFKNFQEVYLWDLDKTYLDTSWGSLRELWRTAVEKAFQKKNVPGTASLVTALKMSWTEKWGKTHFPLFFITASPPQMEEKIREKWALDEIIPMAAFFKDNLLNLKPGRFWMLTHQIGFKLTALMHLRKQLGESVTQVLWGDDSEADATIYSLYSDICSHRRSESDLRRILKDLRVSDQHIDQIFEIQKSIPSQDPVDKIYINLATDTDPEYYLKFGRRVVATQNTFQVALDLYQDQRLNIEQVVRVALDMIMNFEFNTDLLERSLDDLIRRKILGRRAYEELRKDLVEHGVISENYLPSLEPIESVNSPLDRTSAIDGLHDPWIDDQIDYVHDIR